MMNSLITVLTNFVRIYLIRKFIAAFFDEAESNKKRDIVVCGIFFAVNTGAYFAFHLSFVNLICNIVGISALVLLRTKSVKMYFLVTYSVYLVSMICDCIVVSAFVNYTEGESFNQVCIIIEIFLLYICELLAERIVCHRKKMQGMEKIPLIVVPLICMVIMIFLIEIHDEQAVIIVGIGLLIVNFIVLYLYDIIVQMFSEKYENGLLQQQIQIYENHIEVIMQNEDKVRSLRHDLKHHLNELQYLIEKRERNDAVKYIDDMKSFLQNPDEIVGSGNVEMDSLLNYMLRKAENSLTTVKAEVSIPEKILPAFDINVILGNLLENAIEAAEQSEEKSLEMRICYRQGVMTIEMKNSFAGELRRTVGGFLTTKTEEGNHGIGLTSVKGIVEKYNGSLETETEGNIFRVNVVLYLSQF